MKIKKASLAIAAVSVLLGFFLATSLRKFSKMFSEMEVDLPAFTRFVMSITPTGWLAIFALLGVMVIAKDFFVSSKWFDVGAIMLLGLMFIIILAAVFLPLDVIIQKLEHH